MGVVRKDRFAQFGQADGSDLEHTILPHLKLPHILYVSVQAVAATQHNTTLFGGLTLAVEFIQLVSYFE